MRNPLLYVAVGMKGIGKSKRTMDILQEYLQLVRQRVLLVDTQDEYWQIRSLRYDQVSLFSQHPEITIRRIRPFKFNGDEMTPDEKAELTGHILNNYRNGMLVLEDINDYLYDYVPMDIVGKILSQRHKGMDIIMHFHSLGAIQKKIWRHINVIRMHKCEDNVVDNKDKFTEKYELFKVAENLVNDQYFAGNIYFSLELLMAARKITGEFTEDDRQKAVEDYISQHYNKLINPYLNRQTMAGVKQYTRESAFQAEVERITSAYFNAGEELKNM